MRESIAAIMEGVARDSIPLPRLIANNTIEYYSNQCRVIRLHTTDILKWSRDGRKCRINSGGWLSKLTMGRINTYSPVRIYCDRGKWFVHGRDESVAPFRDNMMIIDGRAPR